MEADIKTFDVDCACGKKLRALSELFAGSCQECAAKAETVSTNQESHAG